CPVPSLRLARAMDQVGPGARLVLLATDPMARIDVPFLMTERGGTVVSITEAEGVLTLTVAMPGATTG
ncbi:sulfurtransferase TusA family protein, partial [Brevundimonas sp.]|uniref:sulfurtransferase TusA family protein n=1 Tax=Brevundimonas sp. TaxID=1871086 RepID=UPI002ABC5F0D